MNILDRGCVLFSFDDGHRSIWDNARDIFAGSGVAATAFVSQEQTMKDPNAMTVEQLKNLEHSYGWDICSHTNTHVKLPFVEDDTKLETEFLFNIEWMKDNGFGFLDVVAYPWGLADDRVKTMARRYHTHGRICMHNSRMFETIPFADSLAMTARPFSFEHNHVETMPALESIRPGNVLIIYAHWCQAEPNRMACPPDELRSYIQQIKGAGLNIVTFSGLLAAIKTSGGMQ